MKQYLLILILWLGTLSCLMGQTTITEIKGKVTDSLSTEPLIGASVAILRNGAIIGGAYTDDEGEFVAAVPASDGLMLQVTYVNYKKYILEIGSNPGPHNILLQEDITKIEEIVVTGYIAEEKRNVTGSVVGIRSEDVQNIAATTVNQILQGRAAGVMVMQNSGTPGGGITIRVRGVSSINSGNQPLFVIDGVPMTSGDVGGVSGNLGGQGLDVLSSINPNDIESMEILKDAASAAIYGARASNGVVLITTKRGKVGQTQFNFNMWAGFEQPWKKLDMLDSRQFMELRNEGARNDIARNLLPANFALPFDSAALVDNAKINTRWQDEIFRTSIVQNYEISASGGTEKARYYVGATLLDQDGMQIGQKFQRFSPRVNLDFKATKWLSMGVSSNIVYEKKTRTANDNNIYGPVGGALLTPQFFTIKNPDGTWTLNDLGSNAVGVPNTDENDAVSFRTLGNAYLQAEIIKGLFVKTLFGLDMTSLNERLQFSAHYRAREQW